MKSKSQINKYSNYFSEQKLFQKIVNYSTKVGKSLLYYALILYFLITDRNIPFQTRLIFMAALGYFILPTDLISDFLPVIGFTDDFAFITYAIGQGSDNITDEIKSKANEKLNHLLNNNIEKIEETHEINKTD